MRQSTAPNRKSHGAGLSSAASTAAAQAKLLEKKKEFEAISALSRSSALMVQRIEGLGDECDIMADAGKAHGQVLEQWPKMFQILALFLANREKHAADIDDATLAAQDGELLVRVPVEELQTLASDK